MVRGVDSHSVDLETFTGLVDLDTQDLVIDPPDPGGAVVGGDRDNELVTGMPHLFGMVGVRVVGEDIQDREIGLVVALEAETGVSSASR